MKITKVKITINRAMAFALLVAGFYTVIFSSPTYALSRQYRTKDISLKLGMAVALSVAPEDSTVNSSNAALTFVERSSQSSAAQTVGVVVELDQDGIGLTGGPESTNTVHVATDGEALVYVTDINGVPRAGDLLAPSPLRGILMKAVDGMSGVVGAALSDFDPAKSEKVTVQGSASGSAQVAIININLDVKTSVKGSRSANFLEKIGQVVVGRDVSALQVVIALLILLLLIVIEGTIIYASVDGYIKSLGRNPLARKSLLRGLLHSFVMVVGILLTGGALIYGVLQL